MRQQINISHTHSKGYVATSSNQSVRNNSKGSAVVRNLLRTVLRNVTFT